MENLPHWCLCYFFIEQLHTTRKQAQFAGFSEWNRIDLGDSALELENGTQKKSLSVLKVQNCADERHSQWDNNCEIKCIDKTDTVPRLILRYQHIVTRLRWDDWKGNDAMQ